MNALAHNYDPYLSSEEQVQLFEIAHQMKESGLPTKFIAEAIRSAFHYDGIADLLKLWHEETEQGEKNEIVADISELLEDIIDVAINETMIIKFNDLDAIAKDIRKFKDSLLTIVNKRGGITKLAKLTDIPQPSLSRFFNSDAMPRRATLLKIAKALKLEAIDISTPWTR